MILTTAIFIGRSGCGKGTQAQLLTELLTNRGVRAEDVMNVSSGDLFRQFAGEGGHTQDRVRDIMNSGKRLPDFLAVRLWANLFVAKYKPTQHLVIDGMPRSHAQARMIESALQFYERDPVDIVHLKVTNEWSIERLAGRKRVDDLGMDKIKQRLAFFEDDVLEAIDYFRGSPHVRFHEVNGEQSIDAVHKDVAQSMRLLAQ
ncbi:MAG: hypothetical protein COV07_02480 [Candidatus Vogelbacteria bacterium CG10_big_fil_rev_8_21_14_0_10_45_14]|uniref:Adenylate kinase n=1 Tax=Candidatus Vogelbacteria bacterium CG10_big_fil_rev_8_21_14_0_10_45_14 TaxID=1975042 RepID=A0A2H0RM16_9BACT|nr:MAG: hypothetical protein COV07_02480 [Candidatus Vogelbacteria bacterium CG10_big_fil_rev_8_21_14_0_10_45_14]